MTSEHCNDDPPTLLLKGIDQFNSGLYFECHDTLEELWMEETDRVRDLYKGILQIGVALYHERRNNRKGAIRLLTSGIGLIEPFRPACHGVDVSSLADKAGIVRDFLIESPQDKSLPKDFIPRIGFVAL